MYLRCKLDEIMKERKLSIRDVEEITNVNRETIRKLKSNDSLQWHRDSLAKIMQGLKLDDINDLLEIIEDSERPVTALEKKAKQ